jgi:hypothetical protein
MVISLTNPVRQVSPRCRVLTDMGELHRVREAASPHYRLRRGQADPGENQSRPALGGVEPRSSARASSPSAGNAAGLPACVLPRQILIRKPSATLGSVEKNRSSSRRMKSRSLDVNPRSSLSALSTSPKRVRRVGVRPRQMIVEQFGLPAIASDKCVSHVCLRQWLSPTAHVARLCQSGALRRQARK